MGDLAMGQANNQILQAYYDIRASLLCRIFNPSLSAPSSYSISNSLSNFPPLLSFIKKGHMFLNIFIVII
jgi:hypothetical protein